MIRTSNLIMSIKGFVFFVLWLSFTGITAQFEGDSCILQKTREKGRCLHIRKCPYALQNLRRRIFPQLCEFTGQEPIICCPSRAQNIVTQTGLRSQEKCKEYSNYQYQYIPEGKSLYKTFVAGGLRATAKEFPHMALLGYGEKYNIEWKCGGTLISKKFVLTAGHCLVSQELGLVKYVRLGDLNIRSNQDDAQPQNFHIKAIHRHPRYKPPSHYNDIALIQLDRPVKFTNYVKPACLQTGFNLPVDISPVATGWGKLSFTGDASEQLMKVSLSYYKNDECKRTYGNIPKRRLPKGIDPMTQLCAGGFNTVKDTCPGDSGGPLQIKYSLSDKLYYVIGITSFGKGCGIKNIPGVYTRVSSYVPWIERIVWPKLQK